MRLNKIKTFYRIRINPTKREKIYASVFDDLRKELEKSSRYQAEFRETYKGLVEVFTPNLTDAADYIKRYGLAELKKDTLESEFVDGISGKTILMPRHVRKKLLSLGMEIEKVILLEDLNWDQLDKLETEAREKGRTILPIASNPSGCEIRYMKAPYDT